MSESTPPPAPPPAPRAVSAAAAPGRGASGMLTGTRGAMLIIVGATLVVGIYLSRRGPGEAEARRDGGIVAAQVAYREPAPPAQPPQERAAAAQPEAQPPEPPPPYRPPSSAFHASSRLAGLGGGGTAGATRTAAAGGQGDPSELDNRLKPTRLEGRQAGRVSNPAWMLRPGTPIPCVLDVAIDSTLPGKIYCHTQRAVWGSTGTVRLLDKDTQIEGELRGDIQQGQNRIFVVASTAVTPDNVKIDLDSAITDALGRTGLTGELDTHFWQRMGGALVVGLSGAASSAGMTMLGASGINAGAGLSAPSNALNTTLNNSVNIRPTLRLHQGEIINVEVNRWLDFTTVYEVREVP